MKVRASMTLTSQQARILDAFLTESESVVWLSTSNLEWAGRECAVLRRAIAEVRQALHLRPRKKASR